jgi:hypothetical protein
VSKACAYTEVENPESALYELYEGVQLTDLNCDSAIKIGFATWLQKPRAFLVT